MMHLYAERRFHLGYRTVKRNLIPSVGNLDVGETFRLQPCSHLVQIVPRHSKPLSELLRGQVLVVVRRRAIAQFGEELVQILLLRWGRTKIQRDAWHRASAICAAKVIFRPNMPVDIPSEGHLRLAGQSAGDPVWACREA